MGKKRGVNWVIISSVVVLFLVLSTFLVWTSLRPKHFPRELLDPVLENITFPENITVGDSVYQLDEGGNIIGEVSCFDQAKSVESICAGTAISRLNSCFGSDDLSCVNKTIISKMASAEDCSILGESVLGSACRAIINDDVKECNDFKYIEAIDSCKQIYERRGIIMTPLSECSKFLPSCDNSDFFNYSECVGWNLYSGSECSSVVNSSLEGCSSCGLD